MPKSVQRWVTKRSSSTNEPGIEQQVDALARGELARLVLLVDALLAAAGEARSLSSSSFRSGSWGPARAPWARGIADNRGAEKGDDVPLYGCVLPAGVVHEGCRLRDPRRPERGRTGARALAKHKFAINDKEYEVEVGARQGRNVQVTVNGKPFDVELKPARWQCPVAARPVQPAGAGSSRGCALHPACERRRRARCWRRWRARAQRARGVGDRSMPATSC